MTLKVIFQSSTRFKKKKKLSSGLSDVWNSLYPKILLVRHLQAVLMLGWGCEAIHPNFQKTAATVGRCANYPLLI